jgi:hypothetical protein
LAIVVELVIAAVPATGAASAIAVVREIAAA